MSSQVRDLVATVGDGREVAVRVHGSGVPVVFLHGTPGSRVLGPVPDGLVDELGVQVVTLDRPGYGGSDALPGRRATECADDVAAVAEAIGAGPFGLVAWSGGAVYALTTAARHPARVTSVALVSPLGPLDSSGDERALPEERATQVRLLRAVPAGRRARAAVAGIVLRRAVRNRRRDPGATVRALGDGAAADARLVARDDVRSMLEADAEESLRQGPRGWAADAAAMVEPWPLDPADLRAPVTIWHGGDDADIRIDMARSLARWLHEATLVEVAGAGHLVLHSLWREVLTFAGGRPASAHG